MGTADEREGPGTPLIVLRVVIRSPDVDTFVAKYSRFLKDDRIFIFTKASQPEGTRVRFTLELADGPIVMTGEGTVTRIRPDTGDPSKPPGMELRFLPLDEPSAQMVRRLLAVRSGAVTPPPRPVEPSEPVLPIHPLLDDLSTKIRTTTPAEAPKGEAEPEANESTDVDAQSRRKRFESLPPAFTTSPTPLPAPLPLPALLTPPHGAKVVPDRLTRPNLPALNPTPALGLEAISELAGDPQPASGKAEAADPEPASDPARLAEDAAGGLPTVETPPRVVESWCGPLPPPPGAPAPPPKGEALVPANPFGDISDGAIEYFIEWSLEQSTAARPKGKPPQSARFANVAMAPPRAEPNRERSARRLRLWIGLLVGLTIGLPLGAAGMWAWRPRAQASAGPFDALARTGHPEPTHSSSRSIAKAPPSTVPPKAATLTPPPEAAGSSMASTTPPPAMATPPTATVAPTAMPARAKTILKRPGASAATAAEAPVPGPSVKSAEPILTAHVSAAETQPSAPPAAAELPAPPPVAPHRNGRIGTFHIESKPPGAEVTVKGEPRGPAPVDVELPPNHRYEILVEWPNKGKPWRHRINLKPPLTQVTAIAR